MLLGNTGLQLFLVIIHGAHNVLLLLAAAHTNVFICNVKIYALNKYCPSLTATSNFSAAKHYLRYPLFIYYLYALLSEIWPTEAKRGKFTSIATGFIEIDAVRARRAGGLLILIHETRAGKT